MIFLQGVYTITLFVYHVKSEIHCTGRFLIGSFSYPLTLALSVPIYEFVILPILRYRTLSMLKRMGVGLVLSLLGVLCLFIMDFSGHAKASFKSMPVETECLLYSNNTVQDWTSGSLIPLDPRYLILPSILVALGEMQVYIPSKGEVFS